MAVFHAAVEGRLRYPVFANLVVKNAYQTGGFVFAA